MPSVQPDSKEIQSLLNRREFQEKYSPVDLYTDLHSHCLSAVEDGYTSLDRARILLDYLSINRRIASIYPNNVLAHFLEDICATEMWTSDYEHDLLLLIYSLYVGYENTSDHPSGIAITAQILEDRVQFTLETLTAKPRPPGDISFALSDSKFQTGRLKDALLSDHVDSLKDKPDLKDKFVGFTGKFKFGSRATCFKEARRHGAVPCNPAPYMEYLFVSSDFVQKGAISSKIDSAIFYRRIYGRPLILGEQYWTAIVDSC